MEQQVIDPISFEHDQAKSLKMIHNHDKEIEEKEQLLLNYLEDEVYIRSLVKGKIVKPKKQVKNSAPVRIKESPVKNDEVTITVDISVASKEILRAQKILKLLAGEFELSEDELEFFEDIKSRSKTPTSLKRTIEKGLKEIKEVATLLLESDQQILPKNKTKAKGAADKIVFATKNELRMTFKIKDKRFADIVNSAGLKIKEIKQIKGWSAGDKIALWWLVRYLKNKEDFERHYQELLTNKNLRKYISKLKRLKLTEKNILLYENNLQVECEDIFASLKLPGFKNMSINDKKIILRLLLRQIEAILFAGDQDTFKEENERLEKIAKKIAKVLSRLEKIC